MKVSPFLRRNLPYLLVIIPPVVLLPLAVGNRSQESKCAYGLLLMACYWTTEAFPLAVTAMLATILFPMMGVSKVGVMASKYYNAITFVLIGGLAVAIAIERWNLHKRFALRMLLLTGTSPKWLMLGFMLTTSFTSMWISNTATTSMMIPIAQSVLIQLVKIESQRKMKDKSEHKPSVVCKLDTGEVEVEIHKENQGDDVKLISKNSHPTEKKQISEDGFDFDSLDPKSQKICKAMLLSICYSATCGGIGTLTGTGPNLVLKGQADALANGRSGITFATWFVFSFPVAVVAVFMAWIVIQVSFFGIRSLFRKSDAAAEKAVRQVIQDEYNKLGPMLFAEKAVLVHFILLVVMWFSLEPEFAPGWSVIFRHGYVGDAVPGVIIVGLLFICPSRRSTVKDTEPVPRLMDWHTFNSRFPWSVALLLGGGFALAQACQDSGLSIWLAKQLNVFSGIPPWAMVLVICLILSLSTEITSNTAISSIFLPILADLAKGIQVHPIYIMLPGAVSTSFAFMLPVATPPNTIAFSYGYLKVTDMIKTGWFLNISCVALICLAINTWGIAYFGLDVLPEWAIVATANTTVFNNSMSFVSGNVTLS